MQQQSSTVVPPPGWLHLCVVVVHAQTGCILKAELQLRQLQQCCCAGLFGSVT
jgi:hypothetical protein